MWSVRPPAHTAVEAANACAHGLRDRDLGERLNAEVSNIEENSASYQGLAVRGSCSSLISAPLVVKTLSDAEMIWLYNERFVNGRAGREIYNAIKGQALLGLCSYCQYSIASTLDHFVPKSVSPALAIDPWNLIPCCKDCNQYLLDFFGSIPDEEFLHPYFMPPVGRWLYARVASGEVPAVEFFADPSLELDGSLRRRIVFQFKRLGLASLYSTVSAPDLAQIAGRARRLGDEGLIRSHLEEMAIASAETGENSRRRVIYEALAASRWYCTEGYLLL